MRCEAQDSGITIWARRKRFESHEGKRLEFRASFFNLFNHANFSNPVTALTSPTFGQLTGTTGDPRIIEFGLKFYY